MTYDGNDDDYNYFADDANGVDILLAAREREVEARDGFS